jgi:hypothetical protein
MTFAVATLALSTLVSAQVGEESEAKVPANATMPMPSLAPEGGLAGVPTFHMVMPGYSEGRKPNEKMSCTRSAVFQRQFSFLTQCSADANQQYMPQKLHSRGS